MNYPEAAFFDGQACQHVADWQEVQRLARIDRRAQDRRRVRR